VSTSLFHVTSSNNPCHCGLEAVSEGAINDTQFTDLPDHLGSLVEFVAVTGIQMHNRSGPTGATVRRPSARNNADIRTGVSEG